MNKTTVGIMLLGAMVFTRAFLVEDSTAEKSIVSRDSALDSNVQEALLIRSDFNQKVSPPIVDFLAHHFQSPDFVSVQWPQNDGFAGVTTEMIGFNGSTNLANMYEAELPAEEIIPMDIQMNTGYGLWKSSNEKILSKEERNGVVPLDRGSTISDNISKLFPREP